MPAKLLDKWKQKIDLEKNRIWQRHRQTSGTNVVYGAHGVQLIVFAIYEYIPRAAVASVLQSSSGMTLQF